MARGTAVLGLAEQVWDLDIGRGDHCLSETSMIINERKYFGVVIALIVTSGAAGGPFFTPVARPVEGIVNLGSRKELLLDDVLIASSSNLSKFAPRSEKYIENPVLRADQRWEPFQGEKGAHGVGVPAVLYDEDEKIFKMWYLAAGPPGRSFCCYATSADGYHWEKPELGLFEYEGSKRNNIWAIYTDPGFFDMMKDSRDPDPRRRYKAMGEWENSPIANTYGGAAVAFSPDGLHWTPYDGNPVIHHGPNLGDAPTMMGWDPLREKYVAYPRPGHPLAAEISGAGYHRHLRTVGYSESDDFMHWTPTRVMIVPGRENRIDSQFESFRAVVYGAFYLGLVPVRQSYERTFEIFLLSSRDGFNWNWINEHAAFLQRGELGSYDGSGMGGCSPLIHDGKLWMYYSSRPYPYKSSVNIRPDSNGQGAVCLATCAIDRCAGLLAGLHLGALVTRPVIFTGKQLQVDIEPAVAVDLNKALDQADGGKHQPSFDECEVRVGLFDQSGGRLEGFTPERCRPLTGSGPQKVEWEGGADVASLAGKPVRLRFEMRNAALYGFQFR